MVFLPQKVLCSRIEVSDCFGGVQSISVAQGQYHHVVVMKAEWKHEPSIASVLADLESLALLSQGGAVSGIANVSPFCFLEREHWRTLQAGKHVPLPVAIFAGNSDLCLGSVKSHSKLGEIIESGTY